MALTQQGRTAGGGNASRDADILDAEVVGGVVGDICN